MQKLNSVPFVSVDNMMKLVWKVGLEKFLIELANAIEEDFGRWESFAIISRIAAHSTNGIIERMPTSDRSVYGFKYVNGHPNRPPDSVRLRCPRRCGHR